MQRYSILWADDEIDLLKPHILFLTQRGYDITPVNNGSDAVELSEAKHFDVVFLFQPIITSLHNHNDTSILRRAKITGICVIF